MKNSMSFFLEKNDNGYQLTIYHKESGMHLTIDEQSEAKAGKKLVRKLESTRVELLILIGVGMGFWIEELLSLPFLIRIVVLEPDTQFYNSIYTLNSIRKLCNSDKVEFFLGDDVEVFLSSLQTRYEYLRFNRIEVHVNELMNRAYIDDYGTLKRKIGDALNLLLNEGLTIARHSLRWMGNFVSNLKKLPECFYVDSIYNRFGGTAIIVGAGPSADKILNERDIGKAFIISTDAGLRPLFNSGYTPNLIVTLDPQPSVMYHFKGINKDILKNIPCVVSLLSYREVFDLFSEIYVYFTNHPVSMLFNFDNLSENIINRESVTSVGFEIAVRMGFNKIVLVGCDFSYPHYRVYSGKTFFYLYNISKASRFFSAVSGEAGYLKKVLLKSEEKSQIPSSRKLLDYKRELEEQIRNVERGGLEVSIYSPYYMRIDRSGAEDPFENCFYFTKNNIPHQAAKINTPIKYRPEIFKKIIETLCLRWNLVKKMDCSESYIEFHFLNLLGFDK